MINVFYGCARRHRPYVPGVHVITNDIDPKCYCNITGDVLKVLEADVYYSINDMKGLIFTPPCNYYSRSNYRRETSTVALATKDLLPICLQYCLSSGKPFLVENVMNKTLLGNICPSYQFYFGGHTFWSNLIGPGDLEGLKPIKQNKQNVCRNKRDGNYNVDLVVRVFLRKLLFKAD